MLKFEQDVLMDRLMARAEPEPNSGCWLWTGHLNKWGYGSVGYHDKQIYAHRLSYQLHKGVIPTGMLVCHKCDTPSCVNPDHLFLGTPSDNMKDMARKDRCVRFSGETNVNSKLTDAHVYEIREAAGVSQASLARKYGISQSVVSMIRRNKRWTHLVETRDDER